MCDFCYGYIKPKYGENAKLCYMNTDSFITHVKTDDICKNIAEDVGTRFDTSNYEIDWLLTEDEKRIWINERWNRRTNHVKNLLD